MARYSAWLLAAVLFAPAPARAWEVCERSQTPQQRASQGADQQKAGRPDDGHKPLPKWWIDPQLRSELGITDQQSAAVDAVWQKSLPALREGHARLDKLEDALSLMIRDGADEQTVIAQIEKVETTRADLNKGRTLMLYRMNRVLTVEQRVKVDAKVKAMHQQRDGERRDLSR